MLVALQYSSLIDLALSLVSLAPAFCTLYLAQNVPQTPGQFGNIVWLIGKRGIWRPISTVSQ